MIVNPRDPKQLKNLLIAKPLVLFGMGGAGARIAEWCNAQEIPYVFADSNSVKKQSETKENVLSPESLISEHQDANIVISSIIYYREIEDTLRSMGIDDSRIFSYKMFMPEHITWNDLETAANWDTMKKRVYYLSEWIDKTIKSIADYGAGKMYMKECIDSDVSYFPIDYIRRTDETIVCDFNRGEFPKLQTDVALCLGIFEVLNSAETLMQHVCENTDKDIIVSYPTTDKFPDIEGRRTSAYLNDLTEAMILSTMDNHGFKLLNQVEDPWNAIYSIYHFRKIVEV